MTLQEAMQEIFYHGFVFTLRPKKALEALKVIRKTLLDYEQLKADYIDIDKQLRTANTENDELKRLLRLAITDIAKLKNCEKYPFCVRCPKANEPYCEWVHNDEAMKLLGGAENAEN